MPSKSEKQKNYFAWMAHDEQAAKKHGIDPQVAKEWHEADKRKDAEEKAAKKEAEEKK